jgi:hypothetical protein
MTKQHTNASIGPAPQGDDAPFETVSKVRLPEGLTLEIFNEAVSAITLWDDGKGEIEDLVIELYHLMKVSGPRAV